MGQRQLRRNKARIGASEHLDIGGLLVFEMKRTFAILILAPFLLTKIRVDDNISRLFTVCYVDLRSVGLGRICIGKDGSLGGNRRG
jgi:hypothetical protein